MKRFFKYFTISITSSFFILILFISCSSNKIILEEKDGFDMVPSGDHKLATKTLSQGNVTVLFESGLGDSGNRWIFSGITQMLEEYAKVIVYCRAGIYPSDKTDTLATIENMIIDLDSVITTLADDDILILVGHSLGGAIIRAYSVKYPEKVSGLVFVDSSHEVSLQGRTDEYFAGKLQSLGIKEHNVVYKEFKEFQNTLKYLETLQNMPDVPVIALSALGYEGYSLDERSKSFINAHKSMGIGLSDFTHIEVSHSGHYIQIDQPEIVTSAILEVLNKVKKKE